MTDDELTEAWEAGTVFATGVTHEQHVRIAWVLHRRYRPEEAQARLVAGTRRACIVHGCPEKFDAELTRRWSEAIASAAAGDLSRDADAFLRGHPELLRGDLFAAGRRVEPQRIPGAPTET